MIRNQRAKIHRSALQGIETLRTCIQKIYKNLGERFSESDIHHLTARHIRFVLALGHVFLNLFLYVAAEKFSAVNLERKRYALRHKVVRETDVGQLVE